MRAQHLDPIPSAVWRRGNVKRAEKEKGQRNNVAPVLVVLGAGGRGRSWKVCVKKKKKKIRFEKQNRLVMACDKHHLGVNPN